MHSSLTKRILSQPAKYCHHSLPTLQSRHFGTVQLKQTPDSRKVCESPTHMTASEAFVETLVNYGVTDVFGIVGSAFMDSLDLFPEAGIRFIPTQHEQNAGHMADGYARTSKKHGVCVAQNGPGITNFVTPIAAAYWAHSPVVAITPECGSNTKGLGGFQEADQLPIFRTITKFQADIQNSQRIPEMTARAFDYAMFERGPTQINMARDLFYSQHEYSIPKPRKLEYPVGGQRDIKSAINILSSAKNPVILAGGGVIMSPGAIQSVKELSEHLGAAVATTYLHNDSFPSNHDLSVGPLGYQGFESAMKCINEADVILAVGSRMNPFGTLPQYGFDYWPNKDKCKIIQIDTDQRRLGLTKEANVYINGDANSSTVQILEGLKTLNGVKCLENKQQRLEQIKKHKKEWEDKLNEWTYSANSEYNRTGKVKPRQALRELEKALQGRNAIVSTDIGNICSVANSYLRFEEDSQQNQQFLAAMTFGNCQYAVPSAMGAKVANPERAVVSYAGDGAFGMSFNELLTCSRENIPITSVVFNNGQWGAEKKNQVLWFGDRYIGVNLNEADDDSSYHSFTDIGRAMNCDAIRCENVDEVGDAMKVALDNQLNAGRTTVIEVMCTKELGDPFRRDAMKLPVRTLDKYKSTTQTKESSTGQPTDI